MSKEPSLRFDLWHLLGLIARRKEAEPYGAELLSQERERLEIFARDEPAIEDRASSAAFSRYQEAIAHHILSR